MDYTVLKKQIVLTLGVFVALACVVFFAVNKGDFVLMFGEFHTPFLDKLFAVITKFGEELGLIPALIFLMWRLPLTCKEKGSVLLKIIICLLGMFAVVVVLKQFVFDLDRPVAFFEQQGIKLSQVDGVRLNRHHSFPSGHTATAFFGWFLVFNLLFPLSRWRNIWFFVALSVGASRIYLGQHFLQDVWAGSLIGYAWAFLALHWIMNKHPQLRQS
jgi:membrane-associated phospholipid phosphatase